MDLPTGEPTLTMPKNAAFLYNAIQYTLFPVCLFLLILVVEKNLKISPKQKHIKFHWVYSDPVIQQRNSV